MDTLKNTKNYNICDFDFLSKILKHPRIEYNDIMNILNFLLSITFSNILYNKCAISILEIIAVESIRNIYLDNSQIEELSILYIDHINKALEIYIENESNNFNGNLMGNNENEEDKNEKYLEMAYLIVMQDFGEVNSCLKMKIIECAKIYYNMNRRHSGILLGMLKKYDDFGNILFEIEQE